MLKILFTDLHEFLTAAYAEYDIMIWSATRSGFINHFSFPLIVFHVRICLLLLKKPMLSNIFIFYHLEIHVRIVTSKPKSYHI